MTDPMGYEDLMRRVGAVWCDQHKRWECSKNSKRSHERCHAFAVRGTPACATHAGTTLNVARAKGEAMTAWSALGGPVTVTHTQAVLGMLQMAWLRVHFYAGLLQQQVADAQNRAEPAAGEGWNGAGGEDVGRGAGLIGHTRSANGEIGVYATGEAVRGLAKLEADERDRVVRFAKTAHDMKIDEQQVRLAEGQGLLLAQAISRILDALELTAAQRVRVPEIVPGVLMAVGRGE